MLKEAIYSDEEDPNVTMVNRENSENDLHVIISFGDGGKNVREYWFNTDAEYDAYFNGIRDMDGWNSYTVLSE